MEREGGGEERRRERSGGIEREGIERCPLSLNPGYAPEHSSDSIYCLSVYRCKGNTVENDRMVTQNWF